MQADTKATTTAQVIDFKAAKRAIKRQQRRTTVGRVQARAVVSTSRPLTAAKRQRRDDVRIAAKTRL